MNTAHWQLDSPIDAIIFDCDGTLSRLEGINELARQNGVGDEVEALTESAMATTGISAELYAKRINLVKPSRLQVQRLGQDYFYTRSLDLDHTLAILQFLNKPIYVISAGVNPAVKIFAQLLNIHAENVFAVDLAFDALGNYQSYASDCPLTDKGGKREVIHRIHQHHRRVVHVGDGMNDLEVCDLVERFVGYGGVYYRESIAKRCQFYIQSSSLLPLLPLVLTSHEIDQLPQLHREFYVNGLVAFDEGAVIIHQQNLLVE